jgi:electron transport complex protein RnfA
MIPLAALAIFSGLSLNLILSFALGAAGMAGETRGKRGIPIVQFGIMFISILFLWIIITVLLPPHWRGFAEYFLFFPLSAMACMGLERIVDRILPEFRSKLFNSSSGYDGLVPISLLITLSLAADFLQAFVFALFFVLGNLAAMLVLNEIRRKSTLEKVPAFLRGSPLVLISMGLLSLITGTTAVICFRILEMLYG